MDDYLGELIYAAFCTVTAMVGHTIHHSLLWSVIDFFFAPIPWIKWLVLHEVNLSIIRQTFSFFLQ